MLIHDPVRWTPVESTGVHQTYIGYVYCTFLESGQWSICDYIRVQSGGLQRTPPDTHLSGLQSDFNFERVQSGGLTGPPLLDNTLFFYFFIPVDSSGLWRIQHVTICDKVGVRSSWWSPAEHVGSVKY